MKKPGVFFFIGCTMLILAAAFVLYALNHPEASFPWGNGVTSAIYAVYAAVMIALFVLGIRSRNK